MCIELGAGFLRLETRGLGVLALNIAEVDVDVPMESDREELLEPARAR